LVSGSISLSYSWKDASAVCNIDCSVQIEHKKNLGGANVDEIHRSAIRDLYVRWSRLCVESQ
jgi:hypothetical protein